MSFAKSYGLTIAALLLSFSTPANAFAQMGPDSTGIVRITDGRVRSSVRQASNQSIRPASAYQNAPAGPTGSADPNAGGVSGNCPTGTCPTGSCPNGHACRAGRCPHCCCLGRIFCEHYCTHSPDYGYSPPAKYPLHRRGVEYTNYYPAQWYGAGGNYIQSRAPMVYQPTDTTQLGFYYQHVPSWQPNPSMLPARPIPAQWHITAPPVCASRYCDGYFAGNLGPYYGWRFPRYYHDGTGWCPVDGSTMQRGVSPQGTPTTVPPVQSPTPIDGTAPLPVESEPPVTLPPVSPSNKTTGTPGSFPPSPIDGGGPGKAPFPTDSASSGHIRRIGFSYIRELNRSE